MVCHPQKDFISILRGLFKEKAGSCFLSSQRWTSKVPELWPWRSWSGSGCLKIWVRRIHYSFSSQFLLAGGISWHSFFPDISRSYRC